MRRAWCGLLLVLLAGCNRQDTEALSRIGKRIATRVEAVTGDLRSSAACGWQGVQEMTVEGRVAARLRWDKQLADLPIEVVPAGTGVELRGKVGNQEQRIADIAHGIRVLQECLAS